MRKGAVDHLIALGWEVKVVIPNYHSAELIDEKDIIQIPFQFFQEFELLKQRFGLQEDYMDKWVNSAYTYLLKMVKKEDILFATTGGEMGPIKLASLLKKEIGCSFVINYRDPILECRYWGKRVAGNFHISREKTEKKYIRNADLILTFSVKFKNALTGKYPDLKNKIKANYFGFPVKSDKTKSSFSTDSKLRIAYTGRMGKFQKPELIVKAINNCKNKNNIELYFIGVFTKYFPFKENSNIHMLEFMPREKLLEFLLSHIDVGFVSLDDKHHIFGVPSKIYDYLNLGLPILGALPEADGLKIINENDYGIACNFNDVDCLSQALDSFFERTVLERFQFNIIKDREKWSMKNRIKEVDQHLQGIILKKEQD